MQIVHAQVEIVGEEGSFELLRNGNVYDVLGAGTQNPEAFDSLKQHGGNSIRTWSTDNAQQVLDKAHELGLTVSLCLNIQRERHGFDYDDQEAVDAQYDVMREEVLKYRDHPALLTWIIGNELNQEFRNPKVYDAVNEISRMIHKLDPNHPTTTAIAGFYDSIVKTINERAPDLDFLSIQVYGGLFGLEDALAEVDFDKPIMITEWGTIGHWEVDQTHWGAPIELNSSEKAMTYKKGYQQVIQPLKGRSIGNYVFLWGDKQERTPTWYGMFTAGLVRTETTDVMHKLWRGTWLSNRAPRMLALSLNGEKAQDSVELRPDKVYEAQVSAVDPEGDVLSYDWIVMRESIATEIGGDHEKTPESLSILQGPKNRNQVKISTPEPGEYRIFVYIYDASGGVAYGNIPFLVVGEPEE